MRILLSAFACEPYKGSEPEVGFQWALSLSKLGHEVHVLTKKNNQILIDKYIKKNNIKKIIFHYYDLPKWLSRILRIGGKRYAYFYFYTWQIGAYFFIKKRIKKIKFDFVHHVTFVSLRYPSFLPLLNIPFILGPVSGGDQIPHQLRDSLSFSQKIKELLRDASNKLIKYDPIINMNFKKSLKIFVNSDATKKILPKKYYDKTQILLAIGTDEIKPNENNLVKENKKINLCFAGNLNYLKGLDLTIEALNIIKHQLDFELTIAGEGPIKNKLDKKISLYNLNNSIKFLGKIPRENLLKMYTNSDILLAPFLRDSGGLVILESLSKQLPVITLNTGGPGIIIDNKCGIKIEIEDKNEKQIIKDLAFHILELANNKNKLIELKKHTHIRIKDFSWISKAKFVYK